MPREHIRYSAQDRRQQILQVAMELFARQGFEGTTTRQIAERARMNEAILFRHFPHKEDLYWAIIDEKCCKVERRGRLQQKLATSGSDREVFSNLAQEMLERTRKDTTLTRLLLFSALENHRLSHRFFRTHVAAYYETLADHIRKRIREGAFRRVDPLLAARGFLGMVVYHNWIQELFGGKRYQNFDPAMVRDTLTDIWLEGMRARAGRNSRVRKPSTRKGSPLLALSRRTS